MWTLVIDTAGVTGSVALGDGNSVYSAPLAARSYSAQLVSAADGLFQQAGTSLAQLDFIAVVTGPGSFTGIRVGLSVAKAWAEVTSAKLIAISRLALCAASLSGHDHVTVALDAGRSELFLGEYRAQGQAIVREALIAKQELLSPRSCPVPLFLFEAALVESLASLNPSLREWPTPDALLAFAARKAAAAEFADLLTLDANYLRRSDAELFSKPGRE